MHLPIIKRFIDDCKGGWGGGFVGLGWFFEGFSCDGERLVSSDVAQKSDGDVHGTDEIRTELSKKR